MSDLAFQCDCGAVRGYLRGITPRNSIRYICHCDDCQSYAQHLKRTGLQDAHGGWQGFQTAASRLVISSGRENLACVILREKLPGRFSRLLRWHTTCCNTPLASTYETGRLSFLSFYAHTTDAKARERLLAPVSAHVWLKHAKGDVSDKTPGSLLRIAWWMLSRIVVARVFGDYRNNSLFDSTTGKPIAAPEVLRGCPTKD